MGETVDPAEDAVRAVDDWIQRMDDRDRAIREAAERAAREEIPRETWPSAVPRLLAWEAGERLYLRGHAEGRAEREGEVRELLVELRDHIVPPRTLRDEDLIRRIAAALKETTP